MQFFADDRNWIYLSLIHIEMTRNTGYILQRSVQHVHVAIKLCHKFKTLIYNVINVLTVSSFILFVCLIRCI